MIGGIPVLHRASRRATPLFRQRLDEKFRRGAENQAFLVESVTGVETLKAMAVEPQMQRRWEEQLASYVRASFPRPHARQLPQARACNSINKLVTAAILFFGAKLVIDGSLTVGELVAFNILAGRVSQPVLRLAQIWQDFHQARLSIARLGDILNTAPSRSSVPARDRSARDPGRRHVRARHVPISDRRAGDSARCQLRVPAGQVVGIVGAVGFGQEHARQAHPATLRA